MHTTICRVVLPMPHRPKLLMDASHPISNTMKVLRLVWHSTLSGDDLIVNKLCAWRHNMPPSPASWQYLRIYSPGGTCSGMLAI